MAPTLRDWIFCLASWAMAAWAQSQITLATKHSLPPILHACQDSSISPQDFAATTGLHAYDPRLGLGGMLDIFVCAITQFFYELHIQYPGGTLVGLGVFSIAMPAILLMSIEAGRVPWWSPIKYPMLVGLMIQIVGISVIFPLIWVPSYILLGTTKMTDSKNDDNNNSSRKSVDVSDRRIYLSIFAAMSFWIFAALTFFIPSDKFPSLWTTCAGIVGGPVLPIIAFLPLWASGSPPPPVAPTTTTTPPPADEAEEEEGLENNNNNTKNARLAAMAYAACGVVALMTWLWLMIMVTLPNLGYHPSAIYDAIWGEQAQPAVKVMTVDSFILWTTTVLYIAYHQESAALEAIMLSFLFGPGAALSMVLAGLQVERLEIPLPAIHSQAASSREESLTTDKKSN